MGWKYIIQEYAFEYVVSHFDQWQHIRHIIMFVHVTFQEETIAI